MLPSAFSIFTEQNTGATGAERLPFSLDPLLSRTYERRAFN